MNWRATHTKRCWQCLHVVPFQWESEAGHILVYFGGGAFKGYAPNGSRVINCQLFDCIEDAQRALVENSK